MAKEIKFGHDARTRIKVGIDKACDAVRPTLGAVGMSAMIEFKGLDPIECDDGVTILKNLEFKDPYENLGLQKLRKAAVRTSTEGGDGTATTTVLTQALVHEAFKEIANDSSKIREVRDRLGAGLTATLLELSKLKREVKEEDIERIANISSLDPEVAKIIAEIIKEVGINGVVTVEKGAKQGYFKEVVKGARFDKGLISPYFINDHENVQTVLEDVYIVLVDRKVSTNEQIGASKGQLETRTGILGSLGTGKNILFIADDVDSVALGTLALNASKGFAGIACVRNPYSATRGREFLDDMASLTGATVISEQAGMRLEDADVDILGKAEKVIVTKDTTTIIGGLGSEESIKSRVAGIEKQIAETTSEYEKMQLEDRLAQLTGGVGVIRVGAYTDTEFHAKKYKFENAVNATQAALQEGILPGGGMALEHVAANMEDKMFRKALTAPFKQMYINAGMEDLSRLNLYTEGLGINFKTKETVNMFDAGIIDPFKVTRLALESAVAITSSLISMETAIVSEDEETNEKSDR